MIQELSESRGGLAKNSPEPEGACYFRTVASDACRRVGWCRDTRVVSAWGHGCIFFRSASAGGGCEIRPYSSILGPEIGTKSIFLMEKTGKTIL